MHFLTRCDLCGSWNDRWFPVSRKFWRKHWALYSRSLSQAGAQSSLCVQNLLRRSELWSRSCWSPRQYAWAPRNQALIPGKYYGPWLLLWPRWRHGWTISRVGQWNGTLKTRGGLLPKVPHQSPVGVGRQGGWSLECFPTHDPTEEPGFPWQQLCSVEGAGTKRLCHILLTCRPEVRYEVTQLCVKKTTLSFLRSPNNNLPFY